MPTPRVQVLTLLNWGDLAFSAEVPLEVNVTLPFEPTRVESVLSGELNSSQHGAVTTLHIVSLEDADFVLLWKEWSGVH